ncbi:MAG: rane protein [Acidimicrobiales bacterium]|nr:rane protein [Acidimicrobiales bacterium]
MSLPVNRQGRAVVAGSLALMVLGRLFGLFELFLMGMAGLALVAAALLAVTRRRPHLEVTRVLHPPRVYVGTASRVELTIRNTGRRRSGVVRLHDPVTGTSGADLLLGSLAPGAEIGATYHLPTSARGIVQAGPLDATVADPFGIAERTLPSAGTADLTVLPRIDHIVPLAYATGREDPHAGADHPNVLGQGSEDFYALRSYVVGDDLRRVHWPSTARRGELMVRQDEVPWQGRTTVLLDARRGTTTGPGFELAVSAAASMVVAAQDRSDRIRLVTTDGRDSGYADTHAQVERVMEHLAVVERHRTGSVSDLSPLLDRSPGGGLVAVLGAPTREDVEALLRVRARFGTVTVVLFERASWDPGAPEDDRVTVPPAPGLRVLRITGRAPFATVWNLAMSRRPAPVVRPA